MPGVKVGGWMFCWAAVMTSSLVVWNSCWSIPHGRSKPMRPSIEIFRFRWTFPTITSFVGGQTDSVINLCTNFLSQTRDKRSAHVSWVFVQLNWFKIITLGSSMARRSTSRSIPKRCLSKEAIGSHRTPFKNVSRTRNSNVCFVRLSWPTWTCYVFGVAESTNAIPSMKLPTDWASCFGMILCLLAVCKWSRARRGASISTLYHFSYPVDEPFLTNVRNEVIYQVKRLQNHPSIVLWSGNNENEAAVAQNWYKVPKEKMEKVKDDYRKLYVDTVMKTVLQIDKGNNRPFITSSPSNGLESINESYIANDPQDPLYGISDDWWKDGTLCSISL